MNRSRERPMCRSALGKVRGDGIVGNDPCVVPQEGCQEWSRSSILPSSVAGAPPSPPRGRLRSVVQHFQAIPLSHTYKSALSLTTRDCRSSLPPGGEGGAPATDEGETGERTFYSLSVTRTDLAELCGNARSVSADLHLVSASGIWYNKMKDQ